MKLRKAILTAMVGAGLLTGTAAFARDRDSRNDYTSAYSTNGYSNAREGDYNGGSFHRYQQQFRRDDFRRDRKERERRREREYWLRHHRDDFDRRYR